MVRTRLIPTPAGSLVRDKTMSMYPFHQIAFFDGQRLCATEVRYLVEQLGIDYAADCGRAIADSADSLLAIIEDGDRFTAHVHDSAAYITLDGSQTEKGDEVSIGIAGVKIACDAGFTCAPIYYAVITGAKREETA